MTDSHDTADPRGTVNMIPSLHVPPGLAPSVPIHNIIVSGATGDAAWINDATRRLAEWRGMLGSVYIQWSLAINGLHVAAERYGEPGRSGNLFYVTGLRLDEDGDPNIERIAHWSFAVAAERHMQTVAKVTAWALVDMFSTFEDFVFDMYYAYLLSHSNHLLRLQPETKGADEDAVKARNERIIAAKKLYAAAGSSDDAALAWREEFDRLFAEWRRKKGYDGIAKTVTGFFNVTKLKKPSSYETGPQDWAKSLAYLAGIRNALVHGADSTSPELAELAATAGMSGVQQGDPMDVGLEVLQSAELTFQQMLTAFNLSMAEAAMAV